MFNDGAKVQKITNKQVGVIKSSIALNSGIQYQVQFDNGSVVYLSEDMLEPYEEIMNIRDAFCDQQFSGIDSFKRTMTFQRLTGDLTNMFYSMNNTLTDYLPHQFLPVIKFLQSPEERLLIADEVGLGKTVEAMYIWKELEARRNAKRLLVVCPAALREKWKRDIENLFGMHAKIVKADELLSTFHLIERNRNREQFVYICSLESIRCKKSDSGSKIGQLNSAFENFSANFSEYAFDLTIIDEAHYMRNRETANFKTGSRLRDVSEALVLLSATPIQTGSDNLYSILNLLSPEHFDNQWAFEYLLKKDTIFIKLANCMQRFSNTQEDFNQILEETPDFDENETLNTILENEAEIFASPEKRMFYAQELREQVFYNNYFNRTRRRFVFDNTAKRRATTVKYSLSSIEMDIYQRVTKLVRSMSRGGSEITTFSLIARQRQMASCLPAAINEWKTKFKRDELKDYLNDEDVEDLLEDYIENDTDDDDYDTSRIKIIKDLKPFYAKIQHEFKDTQFEDLKNNDSKFQEFLKKIKTLLKQNPKEKIIVFSFFRSTNSYLKERLDEEGISSVAIKGGMGAEKDILLDKFKSTPSINVLISSEVGSEGLDLQFASIEFNYDLPWNPMRLEQRIGRIDRIGQKASVLRIFNLCCQNTIEDRILERLYERIKIFENSIGDMEDIVGQPIQELALEILDPELTDPERDEKADQKIQVLVNTRLMNNRLEEESGVLEEYRELVINSIENAKINKRFIDVDEKIFVVKDFLNTNFPGSAFLSLNDNPTYYSVELSNKAIDSFKSFKKAEHLQKNTSIDSSGDNTILAFVANKEQRLRRNCEIADLDHPIFDWIKWYTKEKNNIAPSCSALTITPNKLISKGNYVFYIQKWKKNGVEKSIELKYFLGNVDSHTIFEEDKSEKILNSLITEGKSLIDTIVRTSNFKAYYDFLQVLVNHAWDRYEEDVLSYNRKIQSLYKKHVDFVNFTADRKINILEGVIKKLVDENGNKNIINMNKKQIEKVKRERERKLEELESEQNNGPELEEIAIGILIVE